MAFSPMRESPVLNERGEMRGRRPAKSTGTIHHMTPSWTASWKAAQAAHHGLRVEEAALGTQCGNLERNLSSRVVNVSSELRSSGTPQGGGDSADRPRGATGAGPRRGRGG